MSSHGYFIKVNGITYEVEPLLGCVLLPYIETMTAERDRYREALEDLATFKNAYPKSVFPEPDWKRAHEVLTAAGMTLDAISAGILRHVANEIAKTTDKALGPGRDGGGAENASSK